MLNNDLTLRETPELRDITARTFAVRADSVDEATRSVEAIVATEDPVLVFDMRSWDVIEEVLRMDGAVVPDQVPMLANHDRYSLDSVYGSTRQLRTSGSEMLGRLYFAEGDPESERAWQKVKQKHINAVSAGYRSTEYTDIDPGQSAVVGGKTYTAGQRRLRVTTRWELREVSLVPIGADKRSKIRSDADTNSRKDELTMNPKLKAFLVTLGLRTEASDAEAQEFYSKLNAADKTRADAAAITTPAAPPVEGQRNDLPAGGTQTNSATPPQTLGADAIRQQAITDERERVRSLTELAGQDVPAEVLTRAVNEGWAVDRASREFLTAVRGSRTNGQQPPAGGQAGPAIHSRSHEVDCNVRSLAAGMLASQGFDPTKCRMHDGRRFSREPLTEQDADRGDVFARLSAVDIARECVRLDSGRHVLDYEDAVRTAVSGASLSHVFSTNVYARLTQGWSRYPDTTMGWCDEEDVPNFLQQEDISVTGDAKLQRLARGDTAKDATMSDSHETYKIARFAKKFTVDEQDFLDDRLGAIMRQPDEMGQAARQLRPDMVYSLMLQNPTLVADSGAVFNATAVTTAGGHANLGTAALSSTGLKAAITAMVKQRLNRTSSKPGDALTIRPQYLIVPAALEWIARELTSAAALSKLFADSSDPFFATLNLLASEGLKLVIDDRIGLIGVWDPTSESARLGTDNNWFLTAGGSKGLRVAYRRGTNRQPQMRSYTLDRGQWGMGWDINMDIGLAFMDYRTWYKSTGAGS